MLTRKGSIIVSNLKSLVTRLLAKWLNCESEIINSYITRSTFPLKNFVVS